MLSSRITYLSAISLNERVKFIKLLFRWQGSVWKLLWADFLWFIILYVSVTLLYRLFLINDESHRKRFEYLVSYMNKVGALVPLSFLLGFFVSTILGRWWQVVNAIPFMSKPSFTIQALITGGDRLTRNDIRHTLVRYLNLSWILCLMNLSRKVKEKFQVYKQSKSHKKSSNNSKDIELKSNYSSVTVREKLDFLNEDSSVKKFFGTIIVNEEIQVFERLERQTDVPFKPNYTLPLMWATKLLERARKENFITSDAMYGKLFDVVQEFRGSLGNLGMYNEFNIPLVYTQVIIIVVYTFLISEIFSQQLISAENSVTFQIIQKNGTSVRHLPKTLEAVFPVYMFFKFIIYMGWFKIGLSLINPFGSDKSDLPLDDILDYNLEVSSKVGRPNDEAFPNFLIDDQDGSNENKLDYLRNFRSQCYMGEIAFIKDMSEGQENEADSAGDGDREKCLQNPNV